MIFRSTIFQTVFNKSNFHELGTVAKAEKAVGKVFYFSKGEFGSLATEL